MSDWLLAQINVAEALHDLDAPEMLGFVGRLDQINAIADGWPGFVWRFKGEDDAGATNFVLFPDNPRLIVNMSVWRDYDSFSDFVFKSGHLKVMQRRRAWFKTIREATTAMWWIPDGAPMPTPREGWERLQLLREKGPTPAAFPLKHRFAPPSEAPVVSAS